MAILRCTPFPGGHTAPTSSGSALGGPRHWSVMDEGAAGGDILVLDVASPANTPPGYRITHYELALSQRNGATRIRRVLGGPAVNYKRRFRADTPATPQRVQLRAVWQRENQIVWNSKTTPLYVPRVGDPVVQSSTGASATVRALYNLGLGSYYVVLDGISGTFLDETTTTVAGNDGNQSSVMHCTHLDAEREELVSEWSLPRDITPAAGAAAVTITPTKTTCLVGEAVIFEAAATGFETERPVHDLRYRFHVDKPGEQGAHAALPAFFESCFGPGSNDRAEGYAQVWTFAPRTSGGFTVHCEVRDAEGNVATASVAMTAVDPLVSFAPANIYAASSTLRPVPGAPAANVFATLEEARAAMPNNAGEALLLLDTGDLHGAGLFTELNLKDKVKTRCFIRPYNANGVGPAAGARATMNHGIVYTGTLLSTWGINMVGPYDPADPFSVSEYPTHGFNCDLVGFNSVAEVNVTGWRENCKLPLPGNRGAYVDLYSTDYQNFAFFGGDVGRHAMAGVFAFTNPRAWRAAGKGSDTDNANVGFFVDHGPYRSSRPDGARGFSKCVFFSCCSWGGTGYPQSPIRLYGNGDTDKPTISHGAEIITEGGAMAIDATTRGGGDTTAHPQDFVWDKFFHVTSMQPTGALSVGMGGVTLRNGVVATSSLAAEAVQSGVRNHLGFSNENSVPGQNDNENNPVDISFVSVIDLRTDGGQSTKELVLSSVNPDFPMKAVSIENMLTYAPNFTLSDTAAAPLDTTPRWTPLYAGQYWWDATVTGTNAERLAGQTPNLAFATPPEVTASFEPGPGSAAYRTATGTIPVDDIRSRLRPRVSASRVAYDPDAV